jgi:hypothetical protein
MGLYSNILYGGGDYYGQKAKIAYSAEPMICTAVDHSKVVLNWAAVDGSFTGARLVRNQSHTPEHEQDGIIIWDWGFSSSSAGDLKTAFVDGVDNLTDTRLTNDTLLINGKYAYYKLFIWTYLNEWLAVGATSVLLPKEFKEDPLTLQPTHNKVLELLPRVFTSVDQSPTAAVDYYSDLAVFLEAFSLTYDEFLSYLLLVQPSSSESSSNINLLKVQAIQNGLTSNFGEVTSSQKQLVREAIYMYQRKGTPKAITTMSESTTGFNSTATTLSNEMLSMADSSFYKSVGKWLPVGSCTLAVSTDVLPQTGVAGCFDNNYTGKVVITSTSSKIVNGTTDVITTATPVAGGKYYFSFYSKTFSGTIGITPTVRWYNGYGTQIGSAVTLTASTATTSWATQSSAYALTAPGFIGKIESIQAASNVVTVWFTTPHTFNTSDSITITDGPNDYLGTFTVTGTGSNYITFALTTANATRFSSIGTVKLASWSYITTAAYVSFELAFGATGTLYLDMISFGKTNTIAYVEPRGVQVNLLPQSINYLKNPRFVSSGTAWTSSSALTYVGGGTGLPGYTGSYTVNMAAGTGAKYLRATTDTGIAPSFYCFSIWAKASSGTLAASITLTATNTVGSTTIKTTTKNVTLSTTWTRFYVVTEVPVQYGSLISDYNPQLSVSFDYSPTSSNTVYFNSPQLEPGFLPTDYFDGSIGTFYGSLWSGTTDASTSYIYINKPTKLTKLIGNIKTVLPAETPWIVGANNSWEFTGIS